MSHLSPYSHMKRFFSEGFRVLEIAESLVSFDAECEAGRVREILTLQRLRMTGVREEGRMAGYAMTAELESGNLRDHAHAFLKADVVPDDAPFPEVMAVLERTEFCFVSILGSVGGVVTRTDVQKPPVRMWLFGLITIIEAWLSRTLEERYPSEGWTEQMSAGRLSKARGLLRERSRRNQEARLIDCLQLSDKAQILLREDEMLEEMGFPSKSEAKRAVKDLESLRNNLAHAQDIVTYDWETMLALSRRLQYIVSRI